MDNKQRIDNMTLSEFLSDWNSPSDKLLVHTSGSTGSPKPLWVEKTRMKASALTTCRFLGLKHGDTALLCMSLDYIAGKMVVVRSLVYGLRLVSVEPCGHPLATLSEAPVFAAMVPMQVYNSLKVEKERMLLSQIKHLIIGGGAIDEELANQLKDFPNAVWSTYGMTETLSHIALRRLNGVEASEWYIPFDGVEISLSNEDCLVIKAPAVCAETLYTNDIAQVSADHHRFRIIGRKDNVICSGGIKIQAEEVERLLTQYLHSPFLITRMKDTKFGQIVVLISEDKNLEGIKAVCKEVLPHYWQPRHYLHVDKIPITETGKPARKQAEEMVNVMSKKRDDNVKV